MRPVDLNPGSSPVVAVKVDAKPNYGIIGGIAVFVLAVAGVATYMAFARLDSVKSETSKYQSDTTAATSEAAATRAKIQSLGQPPVNKDIQIAQGAEQILVGAYGERREFQLMAQELDEIMRGTGGWYESIKASSAAGLGESTAPVTLVGYMPSEELASAFDERVDGASTLSKADLVSIGKEILVNRNTDKPAEYWRFKIEAQVAGVNGIGGLDTSALVGNGGGSGGSVTLSVDSQPPSKKKAKSKPKVSAKPKTPFELAAGAAGGGV